MRTCPHSEPIRPSSFSQDVEIVSADSKTDGYSALPMCDAIFELPKSIRGDMLIPGELVVD
jgi:hypothetical protein